MRYDSIKFGLGARIAIRYIDESLNVITGDYSVEHLEVFPGYNFRDEITRSHSLYSTNFANSFSANYVCVRLASVTNSSIPIVLLRLKQNDKLISIHFRLDAIDDIVLSIYDRGFMLPFGLGHHVCFITNDLNLVDPPSRPHRPGDRLVILGLQSRDGTSTYIDDEGYPCIKRTLIWNAVLSTIDDCYLGMVEGSVPMRFSLWIPIAGSVEGRTMFHIAHFQLADFDRFNRSLI